LYGKITEKKYNFKKRVQNALGGTHRQKSELTGNTVTWFSVEEQNLPKPENELAQMWGTS
jgi:hypothetical protein